MPWTKPELDVLKKLSSPERIQAHLDRITYDPAPGARSARVVLRDRKAHCMGGALFAAACLERLGHEPLIMDLRAVNDDDHVLALFRHEGLWGALGKSNFTTLRMREPVYRTLRELVMSYFDFYFNTRGQKTLREYSVPLSLAGFGDRWKFSLEDLDDVEVALDRIRHYPLVPEKIRLSKASGSLLQAGLLGADPAGLFKPRG